MILRALHTSGILDISSQEQLQVYNETEPFRLSLRPGQTVEIEDHWRKLKNIHNAINCGLLEVVEYDYSKVGEEVTHAELEKRLFEVTSSGLKIELSEHPLESPDGINKTFTLPNNHAYDPGTVRLILNGQTLPRWDIIEDAGNVSVTLAPGIPTPIAGDVIVLTYMRSVPSIANGEIPQETPNGINRTFTLSNGDVFVDGNIGVMVNGIFINPAYITKAADGTGVTINAPYNAPLATDVVNFMYSRVSGHPIRINVYSVEQPNGSTRTFTLPNFDKFQSGDIELLVNGQRLPDADFTEAADRKSVTLVAGIPTPSAGDVTTFIYIKQL